MFHQPTVEFRLFYGWNQLIELRRFLACFPFCFSDDCCLFLLISYFVLAFFFFLVFILVFGGIVNQRKKKKIGILITS